MGAHEGFGQRNPTEEEEKGREGYVQDIAWAIFSALPLRKEGRSCEAQFHAEFTRLGTPGLVVPVEMGYRHDGPLWVAPYHAPCTGLDNWNEDEETTKNSLYFQGNSWFAEKLTDQIDENIEGE